ncbi:hypothetical protein Murru_2588 [Allomuricauda ruestringensis DSM 13258]|uniref:Uncharacterized protein n=1 Tax=Allomuricauda ruestringensis (strain DSM 13258 / CIP 107369 / LMG 19739 / B1) TaxID=886377 RepID=G2PQB8_ALLRU|nr:hypothetical protein [Allomuricauda ruestringensis]AEM71624.1 hypothetical protein Murru_2588 [Allomuricauda ruestringensis DSM 13258]
MEDVNYIKHLNGIFGQFSKDSRLNPTHVSLYVALFQLWNTNYFKPEFFINRDEVMQYAKIGSKSTYHRCIKELDHWNYIVYTPSHNPFKGSRIKMFDFGTTPGQAVDPSRTNIGTSNGQAVVPINKHIQTIENQKNNNKQANFKNLEFDGLENGSKQKGSVPYRDNLKTKKHKDYNQPL